MTDPWFDSVADTGDEDPSADTARAAEWLMHDIERSIFDALTNAQVIPFCSLAFVFPEIKPPVWKYIPPPRASRSPYQHYSVPACERCNALPDPEYTDGKHTLCRACYDGLQLEPLALVDYPITKLFLLGLDTGNDGLCGAAVAFSYPLAQPCDATRALAERRWTHAVTRAAT